MSRLYMPANAAEGLDFQVRWCARCACDQVDLDTLSGKDCPILVKSYAGEQPTEWVEEEPVEPRCTAFVLDVGQGWVDPHAVQKDQARYDALPRDPISGRPVI